MRDLLKNIQGTRRITLTTVWVMFFTLLTYVVAYNSSGNLLLAVTLIVVTTTVVVVAGVVEDTGTIAVIIVNTFAIAVAIVATAAVIDTGMSASITTFIVMFVIIFNTPFNKFSVIYITEAILLLASILNPWIMAFTAILCITVVLTLLCESKLRLSLKNNPPPQIGYEKKTIEEGVYCKKEISLEDKPIPDHLITRLHRRLYNMYF